MIKLPKEPPLLSLACGLTTCLAMCLQISITTAATKPQVEEFNASGHWDDNAVESNDVRRVEAVECRTVTF